MAALKAFGLGVLGGVAGALGGGALGLGGGLAYTELASVSGFEGYSGAVVAYWMLGGILAGAVAGAVVGLRRGLKPPS